MIGSRPLTNEETQTVLSKLNLRDRALYILMLYTGYRVKEALSLKVSDVVSLDGSPLDRITVERRSMKGKTSSRTVLNHPAVKAIVLELIKEEGLAMDSFLFKSRKGPNKAISPIQAWKRLKAAMVDLDGKTGCHCARKTFASKIYVLLGKDLVKTAKALGHRNINSTVSYISFETQELDTAVMAL